MDELCFDYDDPHYFSYKDWQTGTPETAYKLMAGFRCTLKRGLDYQQLFLISRLLELLDEQRLPGAHGVPYTCFSVSYLHALSCGLESTREKYSVARLEDWEKYLKNIKEMTGLDFRMGTAEEVLTYARECFDVHANHPIEWSKLFAKDGDGYVLIDVYDEVPHKVTVSDLVYGDILLVCEKDVD